MTHAGAPMMFVHSSPCRYIRNNCQIPQVDATLSLEIPEPDAIGYQNLVRQDSQRPEVMRPNQACALHATQSAERTLARAGVGPTGAEFGAGKSVSLD
jgi:hypothetical protein